MSRRVPRIAFLHLPKTAGTTLVDILDVNYGPEQVRRWYPPETLEPEAGLKPGAPVLVGHFPFGYQETCLPGADLITFLRDPLERTLSHLLFQRREVQWGNIEVPERLRTWWDESRDVALPVDYVALTRQWIFDNLMVRMLAGVRDEVAFGALTAEHLATAKRNLARFDFIGLQESFAEDVMRLASHYGWWTHGLRMNRDRSGTHLTPEAAAVLAETNALDQDLYGYAQALRAERLSDWPIRAGARWRHRFGAIHALGRFAAGLPARALRRWRR